MDVIVLIFRSFLARLSPFAIARNDGMLYTPTETEYDSVSQEYDPKGLDWAEITDTGPVFQRRPR